ncbi:unnamed protein product [Mycena citricolor]|uniref:Uncharacterized protein n=1 Tax=Mycena citricolor TaxID=2018698 RepID=A0AAD2HP24_9AGAR|nr:unnamed protein product [Mycena citricolor]
MDRDYLDNAPPTSSKPFLVSISASEDVEMRVCTRHPRSSSQITYIRAHRHRVQHVVPQHPGARADRLRPVQRRVAPRGPARRIPGRSHTHDRSQAPSVCLRRAVREVVQALRDLGAPGAASPIAYIACTNTLGSSLLFAEQVYGAGAGICSAHCAGWVGWGCIAPAGAGQRAFVCATPQGRVCRLPAARSADCRSWRCDERRGCSTHAECGSVLRRQRHSLRQGRRRRVQDHWQQRGES